MSDELDDQDSKTEDPTQKRLDDALDKGSVVTSREVTTLFLITTLLFIVMWFIPFISNNISQKLKGIVGNAAELHPNSIEAFLYHLSSYSILNLVPIFVLLIIVIIMSSFAQRGHFVFSFDQIAPDIGRISLQKGLAKMFSLRSIMEFLKGIVKVVIISLVIYNFTFDDIMAIRVYQDMGVAEILNEMFKIIKHMLMSASVAIAFIASADFFYQKYEYLKSLMMSRHDLKEEYKQMEGNPEVKRKQRSLRMQLAKNNMMAAVPKADVVITNPDHYAVALEYKEDTMDVPKVIAKGMDDIALKIKEIARENKIIIFENPPLARALYKVPLDQNVPMQYYESVAEVINYVYKARERNAKKRANTRR